MAKFKVLGWLMLLLGFGFSNDVTFPMSPHWFTNSDAETFGMGDVNLFATGPLAVLQNPANLDTIFCFSSGWTYELRKSNPRSLWKDRNVAYYPQSLGIAIPHLINGVGGILFHQPQKWRGSAENIDGNSYFMNLSLGYCQSIIQKLKLGIVVSYVWGNSEYYNGGDWNSFNSHNTYGIGMATSASLSLNKRSALAIRLMSPTFLRGTESYQSPETTYTNSIKDNIPWEISLGIKHNLKLPLTVASQVTYRNWRRGRGGFIWGDHEWQLHGGFESRSNSVFILRLGMFIQQFYSDLEIPFLKFQLKGRARVLFLTGGIGMKSNLIQSDIGVGTSVFIEHTVLDFYPKRSLIFVSVTVSPEKLLKKQKGEGHD